MLVHSISSEDKYCEGYFAAGGNGYYLGVNLAIAKTKKLFSHAGSRILDMTNAFDLAEIVEANIGQINMIHVSSFCGPRGLIWGYDVCKTEKRLNEYHISGREIGEPNIEIYSLDTLVDAFARLTGTIDKPRFPFLPGSHVPCAARIFTEEGPCVVYAALGIGIAKEREENACLLVEDSGEIPYGADGLEYSGEIMHNICRSIIEIGRRRHIQYSEIFAGFRELKVEENEIGCALVAAPYFRLAKEAFPFEKDISEMKLDAWEDLTRHDFMHQRKKRAQ